MDAKIAKILILYYSRYGATKELAQIAARGVESVANAETVLRTVPPVSTVCEATQSEIPEAGAVYVSLQDLETCDGLILGSPTRFGIMAAPLKYFIDSTSKLWAAGTLAGKPAGVLCCTSSLHGGQEATLLSMMLPLLHHGMLIVGLPYTAPGLATVEQGGGTPYGASHVSGSRHQNEINQVEKDLALAQGKRIAEISCKLLGLNL